MEDATKKQGQFYSSAILRLMKQLDFESLENYLKPGYRVLDIGCGTGEIGLSVLEIVGSNGSLVGIDPDKGRIDIAREKCKLHPNANFLICKGSQMPVDAKFDFLLGNFVFHLMDYEEKRTVLKIGLNVLEKGGVFFIRFIYPCPPICVKVAAFLGEDCSALLKNFFHEMPLTELVKMSQEAGFEVIHTKQYPMEVSWKTLKEMGQFLTGVTSGIIDFTRIENKLRDEGLDIPESWMENGVLGLRADVYQLIISKP